MNEGRNGDQNKDASSFTNNKNIFSSPRPPPRKKAGSTISDISDTSYLDEQHQSLICSIDCHDTRTEKAASTLLFLHSEQNTKKNDESRRTRCTDLQVHTQKEQNLGDNEKDEEYDEQHNTSNSYICNLPGDPEDTNMLRGKAGTAGRHNTTVDTKRRSDDEDNGEELEAERQCSSSLQSLSSAGNTTTSRKLIADQKQCREVVYISHHTTTTVDTPSRRSEGGEDNDAAGAEVLEEAGRQRTSLLSSLRSNSMKRKAIDNHKLQGEATPVDRHSTSDDTSQRSDDEEKDDRELLEAERQRTSLYFLASRITTPRTSRRKLLRGESASIYPSSADPADDDERRVEEKGDVLEVGSQDCTRSHAFVDGKIQASSSAPLYNTPDISREDEKNEERLDDVGRKCDIVTNTADVVGAKMQAFDDDQHTLVASENRNNRNCTTMKGNDNDNTLEEPTGSQIPIPIREIISEQEVEERQQKQDTSNDKLGHQSTSPHAVQEDDYRTKVRNLARNRRKNTAEQNKKRQEEITRLIKANFELKENNQEMINELVTLGVDVMTIQLFLNSTHSANQQSSVLVPPPQYNFSHLYYHR